MGNLRLENEKLKKEVKEVSAERDCLRRERNERADKCSRLKPKMQQQQQDQSEQQVTIRMMQDQLDAMQGQPFAQGI